MFLKLTSGMSDMPVADRATLVLSPAAELLVVLKLDMYLPFLGVDSIEVGW